MFTNVSIGKGASPCVVFGFFGEKGQPAPLDAQTKARVAGLGLSEAVSAALARPDCTGDAGSITEAFITAAPAKGRAKARTQPIERVLLVGLGKAADVTANTLRSAGAAVGRKLAAAKLTSAAFELEGALNAAKLDPAAAGNAVGESIGLLAWVCDEFRGKATPAPKRTRLQLVAGDATFAQGLSRGLGLATSANFARTLSQTPPNVATPMWMAQQAQRMARQTGLSCRVMSGKDLEREKFTGLINVGKASENEPCMIRLEYTPPRASARATSRPTVLVGKTICYDTGGLSLKVNNGMVGMKRDKDGGCAVLGAMHAIATVIKPRVRVVALLAAAENSISDEAYRPDDVLTFRNGVTVEVTNTDAEGRLVLADALCWACDKENPSAIIDLATLTGGVITALGSTYAGLFCEDDKLRARIDAASAASGERVWRLPMHQEYRDMMKSPVADIVNSNPNRKAHPIQGAAFLSYFVADRTPWCHLDIAGVHVAERNAGPYIDGPNGWGVRLLAELLDRA
ncbi:MAG: leucyl aminopeptidase family protein [Phycisphaeraceae bacterium]|nr:leucyl aminopeptidase family protein [Phycisphaeraceae bacterium]MBX3409414.1 leucyl aminopeptidase family protein [Phycisphaeraceae bacterium]